jgi:urea transport system permease protein
VTPATAVSILVSGLLGGSTLLLPTLATALLYWHGRYLPLWLGGLGTLGAYALHALWTSGVPLFMALPATLLACAGIGVAVHFGVLRGFVEREEHLSLLLIGIGLVEVFQGIVSLYGKGLSQHYPQTPLSGSTFLSGPQVAAYWVDIASLVVASAAAAAVWQLMRGTQLGRQIRAVMANRDLAGSLGLPVRRVDAVVMIVAAVAVVCGTVGQGLRNDLQPTMMFYPGLTAVVACVAAGVGRLGGAQLVVLAVGLVSNLIGALPALSAIQRAVPFVLLVTIFAVRAAVGSNLTLRERQA